MKKIHIATLALILLAFCLAFYFYPHLPDPMASHWNAAGEVNGYMSKFWGLYLMPFIAVLIYGMFWAIPKIDPLKKNIKKFQSFYDWFIFLIIAFLLYIYLLILAANLGYSFNMTRLMLPALGGLFFWMGYFLEHAKRNWFIGIRTPWTLSSDAVWEKTHMLGGQLFRVAGALIVLSVFVPDYAIAILLFSIGWAAVYPIVYSYFEYRKQHR